jgi:hypothetical protein
MKIISDSDSQIKTFLAHVYPSGYYRVALCLIPPGEKRVEHHRFTTLEGLTKFLSYARFRNARNWKIYITPSVLKPNASGRRKESFLDYQSVIYLDCDNPSCLDEIKARYLTPLWL